MKFISERAEELKRNTIPLDPKLIAYLSDLRGKEPIYRFAKRLDISPYATVRVLGGYDLYPGTRAFIEKRIEEMKAGFASEVADHPVIVNSELPDYLYDMTCVFCDKRFTGKIVGYYRPPIVKAWAPSRCCDIDKKKEKALYKSGFPTGGEPKR